MNKTNVNAPILSMKINVLLPFLSIKRILPNSSIETIKMVQCNAIAHIMLQPYKHNHVYQNILFGPMSILSVNLWLINISMFVSIQSSPDIFIIRIFIKLCVKKPKFALIILKMNSNGVPVIEASESLAESDFFEFLLYK